MNDKIRINLQMAGTVYPAHIQREDEEMVREAAKEVNIRLNRNRQNYPELTSEKALTITAFEFALELLNQKRRNDTRPYTDKIRELTEVLDAHFKETT